MLGLTSREIDTLRLGALGYSDKGIADQLDISHNTVKQYLQNTKCKIGRFERHMLPGICLLLGIVSIADITREALLFLQLRQPEYRQLPEVEHEGAD